MRETPPFMRKKTPLNYSIQSCAFLVHNNERLVGSRALILVFVWPSQFRRLFIHLYSRYFTRSFHLSIEAL